MAKSNSTEKQKNKSTGKNILLVFAVILCIAAIFSDNTTSEKSNATEAITEITTEANTAEHRTGEDFIGVSDKNIDDIEIIFSDSVPNDVTGNFRKALISENINFNDYALSYYKKYYNNDKEVHAIINSSNQTSICINSYGYRITVTVHEYIAGEENNAKLLFSGKLKNQYFIYIDNGDIEFIQ